MHQNTPTYSQTNRGRIIPGRPVTRWNTTVNIVPIAIPPDEAPDLSQEDRSTIFGDCIVTIAAEMPLSIIGTHRLARLVGDSIERGAAAVVVSTPTKHGHIKLVAWSQSPLYKVGAAFGIDVKV